MSSASRCGDIGTTDVGFESRCFQRSDINDDDLVAALLDELGYVSMLKALRVQCAQNRNRWHGQFRLASASANRRRLLLLRDA